MRALPALAALALLALAPTACGAQEGLEAHVHLETGPGGPLSDAAPLPAPLPGGVGAPAVDAPVDLHVAAGAHGSHVRLEATRQAPSDGGAGGGETLRQGVVPAAVESAAPSALAAAGFLAMLQSVGALRFAGLGLFTLYSRLTRSELLDHEHRDKVYRLIQENPGLGVSEIASHTGLGWGTTVYHLDRLERAKYVASQRAGLHRCYFPVGAVPKEARRAMGALKADTTRNIAQFLVVRPGATQSELCEALGMSPSAASKQITKLEGAGLVRRERDWKTVHLFPEAPLRDLLLGTPDAASPAPAAPAAVAA